MASLSIGIRIVPPVVGEFYKENDTDLIIRRHFYCAYSGNSKDSRRTAQAECPPPVKTALTGCQLLDDTCHCLHSSRTIGVGTLMMWSVACGTTCYCIVYKRRQCLASVRRYTHARIWFHSYVGIIHDNVTRFLYSPLTSFKNHDYLVGLLAVLVYFHQKSNKSALFRNHTSVNKLIR